MSWPRQGLSASLVALVGALSMVGCAFVPGTFSRLEEARATWIEAHAEPRVARYAAAELARAAAAIEEASIARDTLQDPAVIEHLAYVARQRVSIAREAAGLAAAIEKARASSGTP